MGVARDKKKIKLKYQKKYKRERLTHNVRKTMPDKSICKISAPNLAHYRLRLMWPHPPNFRKIQFFEVQL